MVKRHLTGLLNCIDRNFLIGLNSNLLTACQQIVPVQCVQVLQNCMMSTGTNRTDPLSIVGGDRASQVVTTSSLSSPQYCKS